MTARIPAQEVPSVRQPGHGSHVLIVDDDPAICLAYDDILSGRGYEVVTANSRADALAKIEQLDGVVDMLIMDISLPDADGPELVREITDRIGLCPALYVTGWTDEFFDLSAAPGRWMLMQKPIPIPRLIEAIQWMEGMRAD